jgi:CRISPR-associated protein Cas6
MLTTYPTVHGAAPEVPGPQLASPGALADCSTTQPAHYVDATFALRGRAIPIDHGYALFAALSRLLPALHRQPDWSVHPVRGSYQGRGVLALTRHSRVKIRLPAAAIGEVVGLTGQTLDIGGDRCEVGVPVILPLIPAPSLKSRLVTVKNAATEEDAAHAVRRELGELTELGQPAGSIEVSIGPRRVLRVKGRSIYGYAVALSRLDAAGSIAVQRRGLGGRRHMGAGIFVPPGRRA